MSDITIIDTLVDDADRYYTIRDQLGSWLLIDRQAQQILAPFESFGVISELIGYLNAGWRLFKVQKEREQTDLDAEKLNTTA